MPISNTPDVATTEVAPEAVELTAAQLDEVSGGKDPKPPPPPPIVFKLESTTISSY